MRCCCCWPAWLCTLCLALLDLVVVSSLFYRSINYLIQTIDNLSPWSIFGFVLLLVLTIAELVATICLVMSKRQVKSKLVIPRLALIAVQLALAVLVCLLLVIYFSGAAQSMNNVVLDIYEYFVGISLEKAEREQAQNELRFHAAGMFALCFVFAIYCLFVFYITRSHQKELERIEFHPIAIESAPAQPPHNPAFAGYK